MFASPFYNKVQRNKYQLLWFMQRSIACSLFRRGRCKTGEQPWYCRNLLVKMENNSSFTWRYVLASSISWSWVILLVSMSVSTSPSDPWLPARLLPLLSWLPSDPLLRGRLLPREEDEGGPLQLTSGRVFWPVEVLQLTSGRLRKELIRAWESMGGREREREIGKKIWIRIGCDGMESII